jgi:drug/metabolite transporter (DMT)-like permease
MKLNISNIKLEIINEGKKLNKHVKTVQKRALFAVGVTLCLAGALLMVIGNVFGDRTTGIAIVTCILGIGLISTSNLTSGLKSFNKSQSKTANVNDGGR